MYGVIVLRLYSVTLKGTSGFGKKIFLFIIIASIYLSRKHNTRTIALTLLNLPVSTHNSQQHTTTTTYSCAIKQHYNLNCTCSNGQLFTTNTPKSLTLIITTFVSNLFSCFTFMPTLWLRVTCTLIIRQAPTPCNLLPQLLHE